MALSTQTLRRDDNNQVIQHQLGIPYIGKVFYVDPTSGNDSNGGVRPTDAYKTVANAEDDMTTYNHDIVVVLPSGTSGTAETATITWDKHYCHLIGNTAPVMISQRSRVLTTTDSVDPCWTISGNGNIFKNVQLATYQASNDVLVNLTGDRNYFENVHFAGIGHATAGDDATARCVVLNGAEENYFKNCVFGLDTVLRSTTNATIEFDGGAARNIFDNCIFNAAIDNAGVIHVKETDSSGSDRFQLFRNCGFISFSVNEGTAMSSVFSIPASPQTNRFILENCWEIGATTWDSNTRGDLFANMPAAAASAAGGSMTSH